MDTRYVRQYVDARACICVPADQGVGSQLHARIHALPQRLAPSCTRARCLLSGRPRSTSCKRSWHVPNHMAARRTRPSRRRMTCSRSWTRYGHRPRIWPLLRHPVSTEASNRGFLVTVHVTSCVITCYIRPHNAEHTVAPQRNLANKSSVMHCCCRQSRSGRPAAGVLHGLRAAQRRP